MIKESYYYYVAAARPKRRRLESEDISSPQTSTEVSAVDWQLRFNVSALTKRICCNMIPFFCRVARIVTEQVARSVSLSVCRLLLFVDHTKTDELIEMPTCGVQGTRARVQISPREMEQFWFWVYTLIRDHACPSVGILSDSHGDAASPHQYCGHSLAFRIFV